MRIWFALALIFLPAATYGASAKIKKVLPHYVDREGRHTLSPSLYERDAYQLEMRRKPEMRSGLRFDVHWKGSRKEPMVIRAQVRGSREAVETSAVVETNVTGSWLSKWSSVTLAGDSYKQLGELVAWRVTVWSEGQLLAEQQSFLW